MKSPLDGFAGRVVSSLCGYRPFNYVGEYYCSTISSGEALASSLDIRKREDHKTTK